MSKEIKLQDDVKIKAGNTNGVIYIKYNGNEVMITQTVLRLMVIRNDNKKPYDINDKLLRFLQGI